MLRDETVRFLRNVAPFDLLPEEDLLGIVTAIGLDYFPRGTHVLAQGGPPSEHLYIVKKGAVRVYMTSETGDEINIDYRSEGEHFGLLSLLGGDRSRYNVVSVEDTIAYVVPKGKLEEVLKSNPSANEYFLKSFFIRVIDKTQEETRKRFIGMADGEKALFTTPAGSVVRRSPVTVDSRLSIREAAKQMAAGRTTSLVVVDGDGAPVGIVTDRDLREKVVATGLDIGVAVDAIMSAPIIDVDAEEPCFEALVRMMRRNIHHILVVGESGPRGVLTNHDLLVLQGSSPMLLVKEIEGVRDLDGLAGTTSKVHRTVFTLLRQGARARNVAVILTEITEKLLNKVVDLAEEQQGPPPLPYALFLYGDGGRRELTLSRTVSIGIVFEGSRDKVRLKEAETWFHGVRQALVEALPVCRLSRGGECLTAESILSLQAWEGRFDGWAAAPGEGNVRPEMAEMRSFRGESGMVKRLRRRFMDPLKGRRDLIGVLLAVTRERRPPLGFFRQFVVERTGEHRSTFDLYEKGVLPLVDALRLLAIREGVENFSSWGRARELKRMGFENAEEAEHALEYLLTLLMHHQVEQIEEQIAPGTVIDPEILSNLEKKTLKETFQLTGKLYDLLERGI